MNKETLRMQMLAGIITESEYNDKLEEIPGKHPRLPRPNNVASVYYISRAYAGPEEGGRYYDVYEYVCPAEDIDKEFSPEEAKTLKDNEPIYDNTSVGGSAEYRIVYEEYPKQLDGTDTYEPYS
jgi:hypothetical protein